ncbi:MAG: cell division protein FtsQ/DivIB [Gammaproteobacteria bacterium WSBS_2016_MAG_OTU1]
MNKSILTIVCLAAMAWAFLSSMQLQSAQVKGGTVSAIAEARHQLQKLEGSNLLLLDLPYWREQLKRLPGVADVILRRQLPGKLEVQLVEHRPLASWADGGLVDVMGRRYGGAVEEWLPVFKGPGGRAASMVEFYESANKILTPLGEIITQLEVDEKGEWRLFLEGGVVLYLGRERRHVRLRRYASHAFNLRDRFARLRVVDLRYEKGFAIVADAAGEES